MDELEPLAACSYRLADTVGCQPVTFKPSILDLSAAEFPLALELALGKTTLSERTTGGQRS